MTPLTRPEGSSPEDFNLSRRLLGGLFFGGYALAGLSAKAEPIHTDEAGLVTQEVQIKAADRAIPGYLARPAAKGRHPAVIVVSEIFGVHEYIRDVCRRLAKAGYVALAPDYFVRHGNPAPLSDMAAIRAIVGATTEEETLGDTGAAIDFLQAQPFVAKDKLAITGFCWGGAVVWLASARYPAIKAGVAWYGRLAPADKPSDPPRHAPLQIVGDLKAPILGLYAGKDQGIPLETVEQMRAALKATGRKDEIIVYPEAQHGFNADYRASYDPAAAADGWKRMLAHFKQNGVG